MIQMSFSEKIDVLVDVSSSSGINIASIFLLIFMGALFLTTNRKNAKSSKKLYLGIYAALIIIMLIVYHSSLSDMYEYMMNNLFIAIYFPNLAIYLAAIFITNIILWVTIFNFNEDKILKFINTIAYCIIHYLLILTLNVVTSNTLDVFDQASVYKNTDAASLISLSSTIFIGWIIFIVVYKIIRKTQKKNQKEKIKVRRIIRYKKKLPENYQSINLPTKIVGTPGNNRPKGVYVDSNLIDFYKQPEEPKEDNLLKEYEAMFTLEDYKKMLELLQTDNEKDKTKKSKNKKEEVINEQLTLDFDQVEESKQEVINEDIESSKTNEQVIISTEELSDKNEEVPQPKLEELLNLYRSI